MKKTITKRYCDFCGKEIKSKSIKIITPWIVLLVVLSFFSAEEYSVEIIGDGCKECFRSFKKWRKFRITQETRS